jgi:hypothetical protein
MNMKLHASVYWRISFSLATALVSVGIPCNLALADGTLPGSAPALVPTPQVAPTATADARTPLLPFGVSKVVKMYQCGIGKDVIVGYIENTFLPFHLTADGEIYLQHLGVPPEVMLALIRRDGELQRQSAAAYQQQQLQAAATVVANNQAAAGNPPTPVVTSANPDGPAPVVYPNYAAYSYYPYYGYPYFYGPDVIIGGGFGFGRGFDRGFHQGFGHGRGFGGGHMGGFGGGHGGGHR